MMNLCIFEGRLVRTPELKHLDGGVAVVNFSIAVNRYFKRNDDTFDNEVNYADLEAWDSGAETIAKNYEKGDWIRVYCSFKQDRWETADGQKRSKIKFRVNKFERPPSAGKREAVAVAATETPETEDSGDDPIPF